MKPDHFRMRVNPDDGEIWLTLEKPRHPIKRIRKVTNDVLLALCADLSADGQSQAVERSVKFSDGFRCKIVVSVEKDDQ